MRLGSREREQDDVFLLSTTHGAETPALAAAIATMRVYQREPVIEHLDRQGERLADGLRRSPPRHGLADHVAPIGFPCNLCSRRWTRTGSRRRRTARCSCRSRSAAACSCRRWS